MVTTSYEDLLAVSEGEIAPDVFLRDRAVLDVRTAGADGAFVEVMAAILGVLAHATEPAQAGQPDLGDRGQ